MASDAVGPACGSVQERVSEHSHVLVYWGVSGHVRGRLYDRVSRLVFWRAGSTVCWMGDISET